MALNRTPQRSDNSINFSQYREMANDVNRNNNINFDTLSFNVIKDNSGTYVSALISPEVVEVPTEFEIKTIAGYTVTIYGGIFTIGKTDFTIADTPLTITTDCTIGIEYTFGGGAAIVNFGSSYAQDDAHIRVRLYTLKYGTSQAEVVKKCKHVIFPGEWGG